MSKLIKTKKTFLSSNDNPAFSEIREGDKTITIEFCKQKHNNYIPKYENKTHPYSHKWLSDGFAAKDEIKRKRKSVEQGIQIEVSYRVSCPMYEVFDETLSPKSRIK